MNEYDLSDLTYKELQALAVRYRVPGNIKKQLLVRVLQAIQCGNEHEVDRMLTEVQQTRKKRVKKQKPNLMSIASTPIHSPNYGMSHDCYYPRHQQPYQWVVAEEEVSMREEESMRVPNYQEFREFLLHRIQRDYPAYDSAEIDVTQSSSIVDLTTGAGSSALRPVMINANNIKTSVILNPNSYIRPPSSEVELQMLEDANDNNPGTMLLKKMLEAPMGANLGEIASPDTSSHRIWSVEQYPNNSGNPLDDSDTLTADSDNENDDAWDNGNNNNNESNAGNYYCPPMYNNEHNALSKNMQNTGGQLRNNYSNDAINHHYQHEYPVTDIQSNCQKWIASSSFVNRDANYIDQRMNENSRGYNSVYYENMPGANSTITRPINRDRKYQYNGTVNENVNYDANQVIHHQGQRSNWSQDAHQYYQSNNAGSANASAHPSTLYYPQQVDIKQTVGEINQEHFVHQGLSNNMHMTQNSCHTIMESGAPAQYGVNVYNKDNSATFNHPENNNNMQYNSGYYSQYTHENAQSMADFPPPVNLNQPQHQQHTSVPVHESNARKDIVESSTTQQQQQQQPISSGVLETFWPRWPINATVTSSGQLETILNLNNRNNTDYSKINETSCVYCYTEPVVTQRIAATHTWCTFNKPPIAEGRLHLFTPNWLIYNDASTGMRMANIVEPSVITVEAPQSEKQSSDVPSNSSPEHHDSERRASTGSTDSSINDVWIHDYTSYPVSSDNALQSADLTNDENDDDLFSTVRATSQNSIDDHTIETFTDMDY